MAYEVVRNDKEFEFLYFENSKTNSRKFYSETHTMTGAAGIPSHNASGAVKLSTCDNTCTSISDGSFRHSAAKP